jgi:F0F1-type ATP synthase epsilon subunit
MFRVLILHGDPEKQAILYESEALSVFLPGADGEFEILDFHKPLISQLKEGTIVVDNIKEFKIRGGVVKMGGQSLVAIVDL